MKKRVGSRNLRVLIIFLKKFDYFFQKICF